MPDIQIVVYHFHFSGLLGKFSVHDKFHIIALKFILKQRNFTPTHPGVQKGASGSDKLANLRFYCSFHKNHNDF